jgi:hypothetical protein
MAPSPGTAADLLALYVSASRLGRRTLRHFRSGGMERADSPGAGLLKNGWERKRLIRDFRACDRSFFALVPRGLGSSAGPDPGKQYVRLVPFAWFGQSVRTRILDAFEVEFGPDAERRSVLQSFVHREWNDLGDRLGASLEDRYRACYEMDRPIPPQHELLRQLMRGFIALVPRDRFPAYYRMVDETQAFLRRPRTPDTIREWTAESGRFAARQSLYVMREDLPAALESVLASFGLWLYALDAFDDVEADAAGDRANYFLGVGDRSGRLREIAGAAEKDIRGAAPRPERLIPYMDAVTEGLIRAKLGGRSIESDFFGG